MGLSTFSRVLFLMLLVSREILSRPYSYREGDAMSNGITDEEKANITEGIKILKRMGRQALADETRKWSRGQIPFELDDTFSDKMKDLIKESMEEFHNHSCVRFIRRSWQLKYLSITNDQDSGCNSDHGTPVRGRKTICNLNENFCMDKHIILHELMHVLGFIHEHQRPDRDQFIVVNETNVFDSRYLRNFQKKPQQDIELLTPYSFQTIMHYNSYGFSKDPEKFPTLVLPNGTAIPNVPRPITLPPVDVLRVNMYYNCTIILP